MKDFKTKQQMMEGHYCWGGKAMKKAKGGYAEGGMRSESTEAAKVSRDSKDAQERFDNFVNERPDFSTSQGRANARVITARAAEELERVNAAGRRNRDTENSTGYYNMAGSADDSGRPSKRLMDSPTSIGKAKGGMAKGGLRKMRSDRGKTQQMITATGGPRIGGASMPGQIGPADTTTVQSPTAMAAPSIGGAMSAGMKMGGRTKRR